MENLPTSCWQGVSRAAGEPTGKKNQPRCPQTALSPDARNQALSSPPVVLFGGIAGGVLPDIPGGIEARPTSSPFDPELAHPQAPQMTILQKRARIAKLAARFITGIAQQSQQQYRYSLPVHNIELGRYFDIFEAGGIRVGGVDPPCSRWLTFEIMRAKSAAKEVYR